MSDPVNLNSGTPVRFNFANTLKYRQILSLNEEVQMYLGKDLHTRWIGPVFHREFFRDFMPICLTHVLEYEKMRDTIKFASPSAEDTGTDGNKKESRLYAAFARFVHAHGLSPFMSFFISADKKNTNTDKRPDGGLGESSKEEKKKADDDQKCEKEIVRVPPTPTHKYDTRLKTKVIKYKPVQADEEAEEESMIDVNSDAFESRVFNWALDTLIVEFKGSSSDDPFFTEDVLKQHLELKKADPKVSVTFEKPGEDACKIRGQLAVYASHMFNHQQRTHLFQLLITGQYARFIYFDHSGAIVSERFDYTKEPGILGEFFWRMNHMTAKDRGADVTAVKADVNEKAYFGDRMGQLLAKMKDASDPQRDIPNAHPKRGDNYPVYKMTVHGDVTEDPKAKEDTTGPRRMELLVQRPIFATDTPLGRATRGYIAFEPPKESSGTKDETTSEPDQEPQLFLKDTWRVNHPLLKAETHMYRLLESYGVPHVPRVICGGDVRDVDGNTQDTICRQWAKKVQQRLGAIEFAEMRDHRHHRIVQRLAYMIESAKNSEEMTKVFCNILEVIKKVSELKEKILHRDVSVGNVMFEEVEGEIMGLLGDWDHATETAPDANYEHQTFRTGTWAFMSIAVLKNPDKLHEILDDLESCFWTFLYAALHRFEHKSKFNMGAFTYHKPEYENGVPTGRELGGNEKQEALGNLSENVEFKCKPLQDLLVFLADKLHEYYYLVARFATREIQFKRHPTDPDVQEEYEDARIARDKSHRRLSDPSWWIDRFQRALKQDEWIDDVATREIYPERTQRQEVQLFDMNSRTSYSLSLRATSNVNTAPAPVQPQANAGNSTNGARGVGLPPPSRRDMNFDNAQIRPFHTIATSSPYADSANNDDTPSSPSFRTANRLKRTLESKQDSDSTKRLRSISGLPNYGQPLPEIKRESRVASSSSGGPSRSRKNSKRSSTKGKGKGVDRSVNKSTDV